MCMAQNELTTLEWSVIGTPFFSTLLEVCDKSFALRQCTWLSILLGKDDRIGRSNNLHLISSVHKVTHLLNCMVLYVLWYFMFKFTNVKPHMLANDPFNVLSFWNNTYWLHSSQVAYQYCHTANLNSNSMKSMSYFEVLTFGTIASKLQFPTSNIVACNWEFLWFHGIYSEYMIHI